MNGQKRFVFVGGLDVYVIFGLSLRNNKHILYYRRSLIGQNRAPDQNRKVRLPFSESIRWSRRAKTT